jgi:hypothetical protein
LEAYFASLISDLFDEFGIDQPPARMLRKLLSQGGLVKGKMSLQGLLTSVMQLIRRAKLQTDLALEPGSAMPTGLSASISFSELPESAGPGDLVHAADSLLKLADESLALNGNLRVWLLLDRLDVAFAETPDLEKNALRALFRVYLDILGFTHIRLKIFLRTDIWTRITEEGFREGSHITRDLTIDWNENSLLNLVIRRVLQNKNIADYYGADPIQILQSVDKQKSLFYAMFPELSWFSMNWSFEWGGLAG